MINKENINREIEHTLQSLDGLQRATANPFLFTRIKARMQKQSSWEKTTSILNRPSIAYAVLLAVIAINTWAVLKGAGEQQRSQDKEVAGITEIAEEYNLVANNNYYYENFSNE